MYDLKTILLAKRIRRKLDVTRLSVADIALLEIIKNASDSNPVRDATITNGIATFNGVVASSPLVSLKLNIPVTQTGSGTPSPDNIRDFIGFSGVTITRNNGVNTGDTYPITFGQTVYSANLDVLTGKLSITHGLATFDGSENWVKATSRLGTYYIGGWVNDNSITNTTDHLQNIGTTVDTYPEMARQTYACLFRYDLFIKVDNDLYPTLADFKNLLSQNNLQVWYPLATPIEVQLTPTQITTLIGENVIFADVADVTECKYTRK